MKDLHPKLCKSEVYERKKVFKSTHPIDKNNENTAKFMKSYFGQLKTKKR